MAARHILPRYNDVTGGIASEDERRTRNRVLTAIRQRDDSTTRIRGGLPTLCLRLRLRHGLRNTHRLDVLRAAAATLIDECELLAGDFDLVAMEQWRRLGTQPDSIDEDFRLWNCLGDDDLAVGEAF